MMTPDGHRDSYRAPPSPGDVLALMVAVTFFGAGVIVWEWLSGLWHRRQA